MRLVRLGLLLVFNSAPIYGVEAQVRFRIPDSTVACSTQSRIPLLLDSNVPLAGVSVALKFDPEKVALVKISREGAAPSVEGADFFEATIGADWVVLGIVCDTQEGAGRRTIPPGEDIPIAFLVILPLSSGASGELIWFDEGVGSQLAVNNAGVWFEEGVVREVSAATSAGTLSFTACPDIALGAVSVLDFGYVLVGGSSVQDLEIANEGGFELLISSFRFEGRGFSIVRDPAPAELGPAEVLRIDINYVPEGPGEDLGFLLISSNDPDEGEIRVALRGIGVEVSSGVCVLQSDPPEDPIRYGEKNVPLARVEVNAGSGQLEWKELVLAAVEPEDEGSSQPIDPTRIIRSLSLYLDSGDSCGAVDPGDLLLEEGIAPADIGRQIVVLLDNLQGRPFPLNAPLLVTADLFEKPEDSEATKTALPGKAAGLWCWAVSALAALLFLGFRKVTVAGCLILVFVWGFLLSGCSDRKHNGPEPASTFAFQYEVREVGFRGPEGEVRLDVSLRGPVRRVLQEE